jgi:hypothetical protein
MAVTAVDIVRLVLHLHGTRLQGADTEGATLPADVAQVATGCSGSRTAAPAVCR